jgi:hypothetical protein
MKSNKTKAKPNYIPVPIMTDKELPSEILLILESMAQNVHEQWAAGRIAAGWKFGAERNESTKEHPSLIAYNELPEIEKEYDRKTVLATLNYLLEEGFEIRKR